ncbi:prepilin-type N-terminal cleavage/methylation domain-containing protein [Patescibacteria group bacterium]|nr:prepilin-type N-terminal cleavage/methylation domain-containing protein [Patescibacteria group bacterium]
MQNKRQKKSHSTKKGFTLVEIVVVTGIFSVLMIAISGIFIAALRAERNVLASKKVLGELSYAMEYMTRALRMADKDNTGFCIPSGSNYQLTARSGIKFINILQSGACQEFFADNGKIKYATGAEELELTSSNINVSALKFEIINETESDNLQPFVTIQIEADTPNSAVLRLQTSISQRNPDIR